jgi:hypothetical protein
MVSFLHFLPGVPHALDFIALIIFRENYNVTKLLIVPLSPAASILLYLRSKYSPQHPVLKHLQLEYLILSHSVLYCSLLL